MFVKKFLSCMVVALAPAGMAHAASRDLHYVAPPAWVMPAPTATGAAAPDGAPVRIVYTDVQIRLTAAGDENYTAYKLKILTPEGLPAANLSATWNPSTDDLDIHTLRLIRDGKVIDVLASEKFEVIQRENNLENAMLDGQLTATLQVPGAEVGDELEFSATLRRRETVFGDRSHGFGQLPIMSDAGAHRFRLIWPANKTIKLSGTPDLGRLPVEEHNGEHELRYEIRTPSSAIMADEAPSRFNIRRLIEYSQFSDWSQVSSLMAPLFDKAAQLSADSPIHAEAARIAKASADPQVRAGAALQLVEDRIRYVYVGLDGGNYRPAPADETWKRRFGDCKAKTIVLMALLHELGIEAEAVLVNSKGGDGTDQRLPTPQMFDHVLVRTTIDGKTYWLDGTRLGDRRLSTTLQLPSRWALPIKASAARLEAVTPEAPLLPLSSMLVDIDARSGVSSSAKIYMEEVERGDSALQMRAALAGLSREDADRQLKGFWRQTNPWLQPATTSWRYDEFQQALILTVRGDGKMDWEGNDIQGHALDIMSAGFTPPNEMRRPAEQDQSAPWAVDFPKFRRWTTVVRLPPAVASKTWVLYDDPVDLKLGGFSYHREAELAGGVVRSTMSVRSYLPEITAAQASEVNDKLPSFNNKISRVYEDVAPPELTPAQREAAAGMKSQQLIPLAADMMRSRNYAEAARLYDKAFTADRNDLAAITGKAYSQELNNDTAAALQTLDAAAPEVKDKPELLGLRGQILVKAKRKEEGLAVFDALVAAHPDNMDLILRTAHELVDAGEWDRALQLLSKILARQPDNIYALQERARVYDRTGRAQEALKDLEMAVRAKPEDVHGLRNRGAVLFKLGRKQEGLADLEEAWRLNPLDTEVVSSRADLLRRAGRPAEGPVLFDALVVRDRSGLALNDRCWARALGNVELTDAETDCAEAVKLAPKAGGFWDSYALVALRQGKLAEAVKRYDKALELRPRAADSLYGRGLTRIKAGDQTGGEADLAAAKAIDPKAGDVLIQAGL
jgi:tetratricopeptide (TPR) repeat protein